jgi:hypothetical protein
MIHLPAICRESQPNGKVWTARGRLERGHLDGGNAAGRGFPQELTVFDLDPKDLGMYKALYPVKFNNQQWMTNEEPA